MTTFLTRVIATCSVVWFFYQLDKHNQQQSAYQTAERVLDALLIGQALNPGADILLREVQRRWQYGPIKSYLTHHELNQYSGRSFNILGPERDELLELIRQRSGKTLLG